MDTCTYIPELSFCSTANSSRIASTSCRSVSSIAFVLPISLIRGVGMEFYLWITRNPSQTANPATTVIHASLAHGSALEHGILPLKQCARATVSALLICARIRAAARAYQPISATNAPKNQSPLLLAKKGGNQGWESPIWKKFPIGACLCRRTMAHDTICQDRSMPMRI